MPGLVRLCSGVLPHLLKSVMVHLAAARLCRHPALRNWCPDWLHHRATSPVACCRFKPGGENCTLYTRGHFGPHAQSRTSNCPGVPVEMAAAGAVGLARAICWVKPAQDRGVADHVVQRGAVGVGDVPRRVDEVDAPGQHAGPVERVDDRVRDQLRAPTVGVPPVRDLVHLQAVGGHVVVDEDGPRLLLERVLHPLVEGPQPRQRVLHHRAADVGGRVLPQDQYPHIRVPLVDRPHRLEEGGDGEERRVFTEDPLPAEAREVRLELLVVVEPGRDHRHVALARVLSDVREPEERLLPLRAALAVLALDPVAAEPAEAVLVAIAPVVEREVPAVPTDLAEAGRHQVVEVPRVVAPLHGGRVVPRVLHRHRHRAHAVPEPREGQVQLVDPRHPEDVARPHHVQPDVTASRHVGPALLDVLARPQLARAAGRRRRRVRRLGAGAPLLAGEGGQLVELVLPLPGGDGSCGPASAPEQRQP
eukprot:CAMPEP_0179230206 /NCGR_PEP_ID=MMETSP0797-20121207/10720_1 /TAXON_ID=47934 /ORGANISM="Dinophysis acuminata, Strain DAEP01" /LENGTH=475 /DNA_ID=CAMNT_0020937279 /DNA_START=14 /DNA_END=1437 /DNA_ORIENTATION=+